VPMQGVDSAAILARRMAAAIRAGGRVPGRLGTDTAAALEATAASLVATTASQDDLPGLRTALLASLPRLPAILLEVSLAGGNGDAIWDLLQQTDRQRHTLRSRRFITSIYPLLVSGLAALGMLVLTRVPGPLLSRQLVFQTDRDPVPDPSIVLAFGPHPLSVLLLVGGTTLAGWWWVSSRQTRRMEDAIGRWISSELRSILANRPSAAARQAEIAAELICLSSPHRGHRPPVITGLVASIQQIETLQQPESLRSVAGFHRRQMESLDRGQWDTAAITGSLVAGVAVLLYGIMLVQPVTRLLTSLATAPVVPPWEVLR
jgi:hypothetical protein